MKKNDLKKLIKPLVKECIHEVLLEEGLLSNVVAEVAKGLHQNVITEAAPPPRQKKGDNEKYRQQQTEATSRQLQEQRKKMMDAIGKDAYNGVNLFEGTEAMKSQGPSPSAGSVDLGDSSDSGVDISSLMGKSSAIWQALK